jgi:nitrogenase molybdenum-iron protein alpha/beta subunit
VDRVIEQCDGTPKKTADDFSDDQAERGNHSPAEHGGLQHRVRVRMIVAVVRVSGKTVAVLVSGFGRIAGLGRRSLRLGMHPELV